METYCIMLPNGKGGFRVAVEMGEVSLETAKETLNANLKNNPEARLYISSGPRTGERIS